MKMLRGFREDTAEVEQMLTNIERLLLVFAADLQMYIVHAGKFIHSKSFVQLKMFCADEITRTDTQWIQRMKYVCNEYTMDA
jgi:hypothetical protein